MPRMDHDRMVDKLDYMASVCAGYVFNLTCPGQLEAAALDQSDAGYSSPACLGCCKAILIVGGQMGF